MRQFEEHPIAGYTHYFRHRGTKATTVEAAMALPISHNRYVVVTLAAGSFQPPPKLPPLGMVLAEAAPAPQFRLRQVGEVVVRKSGFEFCTDRSGWISADTLQEAIHRCVLRLAVNSLDRQPPPLSLVESPENL